MTSSIAAGSPSMKVARPGTPALLTSRWMRGCRSSTRAATASTIPRSATSQTSNSPPTSSASERSRSWRRARRTQCQPRRESARAISAPMPDEAPVTTATLSTSRLGSHGGRSLRRQARARARCREQALDRLGDRAGARGRWRAARLHVPGRAVDVSAYSLVACARAAEPLMQKAGGGSIVTMTYLGGERAVPHYNVMGVAKATLDASVRYLAWDLGQKNIRVNAVSAGPVRTLAARSIAGFPTMEAIVEERSPLHRRIEAEDVGAAAAYLLSDGARNVTGTTLYVDSGYHAMGM